MNNEYKSTTAETTLTVTCDCPYCGEYLDVTDPCREVLDETLRAEGIETEITCESCKEVFIITEIFY